MAIEIAQNLDAINMVRAQQNVVGRSIIGGAGAVGGGNLIGQGEQTDILTSIQLISEKTFKAIKQQTDTIVKILEFDKKKDRREKEQRAEDKKEAKTGKGFIGPQKPKSFKDQDIDNNKKKGFGILEFFAASSLGKSLTKIFIPIRKFIGVIAKSRIGLMFARLGPLFAASGPLAIIGGALFVLFRYSKEIAAALSPAVESLKKAFENLKPVFDVVMYVVDVVFKNAINALGVVFTTVAGVVEGITGFIGGILNFLGGLIDLFKADEETQKEEAKTRLKNALSDIMNALFAPFKALITSVAGFIDGLIDSFKIPDWIKNKVKKVFKTGEDTNMDTSKFDTNNVRQKGFGGESTPDSKKSLFTSSAAYGSDEIVEKKDDTPKFSDVDVSKIKTKNIDDTSSATSAVTTKIVSEKSSAPQIKKYDIDLTSPIDKLESEMQSYEKRYGFNRSTALFADTEKGFYERQKQQNSLGMGTSSTVYDDFKKYQSLVASQIVRTGDESDVGMLEQASGAQFDDFFDSEGNRLDSKKLASRVGKKDIVGDTGAASGGTVITDAKQTIVTNSNTTRQDTYVGGINTSSGDSYFDRQTGSYAT
jgi:hypothetical protein